MQPYPLPSSPRSAGPLTGLPSVTTPGERPQSWRTRAKATLNKSLSAPPAPTPVRRQPANAADGLETCPNTTLHAALHPTVLVAHPDEEMLGSICAQLRQDGFTIVPIESGPEVVSRVRMLQPALVLLDLALPVVGGLEVCRLLKADPLTSEIQIILLSGDDNVIDRLVGFEIGVDDFVATPCNLRELSLRTKAVMRRTIGWQDRRVAAVGPIVINHAQCTVLVHGQRVHLTATEFRLLALLAGRAGVVQSRDTLLCEIWGDEEAIDTRSVDTYLRRLRAKLGEAACHLKTVRGLGYRLAA